MRPGPAIRDFLSGKRKRYVNPISYLLLASAAYVLILHFLGLNTFFEDVTLGFAEGAADKNDSQASTSMFIQALNVVSKNHTYGLLLTLPLFALNSYLIFMREKYSYFEHLVINMYITGQQMLIYLTAAFLVVKDTFTEAIPLPLGMAFNCVVLYQIFTSYPPVTRILYSIATYLLFYVQIFLLALIVAVLLYVTK